MPRLRLSQLLQHLPHQRFGPPDEVIVSDICFDSRQAGPGALFVAVPGFKRDGHDFIGEALSRGAAAVAVQADRRQQWEAPVREAAVPAIVVADTRRALAPLAAAFYDHPARKLRVIGVTGTDGKTSVVHLTAHLLETAGQRTGLISTVRCQIGGQPLAAELRHTTPEAPQVQAMLKEMADAGCRYTVIEATSHGLALHRLDGCHFDAAALTNIGTDHIDFHGSQEEYVAAKGRLFALLAEAVDKGIEKTAILNADDAASDYFRSLTRARITTYAVQAPADVGAQAIERLPWGSRFRLLMPDGAGEVCFDRPGLFNVSTALAAAATAHSQGLDLGTIVQGLESFPGVPGRLERIDEGQPFTVVVDFAHAPQSLRRVLSFLRQQFRGRIIVVFGCIGERDKQRRFPMGQAAAELADYTIVSDDNPYGEDREAIIEEIAQGLQAAGKKESHHFARIADRREAIAQALAMAVEEDVVLLAGKGHEDKVYLGDGWYPCDDREVARQVLRELFPRQA